MQSPEDFMHAYFSARAAETKRELASRKSFRERFFASTCGSGTGKKEQKMWASEVIDSVSFSDEAALVITHLDFIVPRFRYHLQKSNDTWLIGCVEGQCPYCHGDSGTYSCECCGGTGWMDSSEDDTGSARGSDVASGPRF
jgi:hypothetical protein